MYLAVRPLFYLLLVLVCIFPVLIGMRLYRLNREDAAKVGPGDTQLSPRTLAEKHVVWGVM